MTWRLVFARDAQKDAVRILRAGLKPQTERLLEVLRLNPFQTPPPFEKLCGDLAGAFSRRINLQHRLVYQVLEDQNVVKVLRLWSHYE